MTNQFGAKLRELRQVAKVSLRALADAVGISASYLHDVETGKRAPLSSNKMGQVAVALKLTRQNFFELEVAHALTTGTIDVSDVRESDVSLLVKARNEFANTALLMARLDKSHGHTVKPDQDDDHGNA